MPGCPSNLFGQNDNGGRTFFVQILGVSGEWRDHSRHRTAAEAVVSLDYWQGSLIGSAGREFRLTRSERIDYVMTREQAESEVDS